VTDSAHHVTPIALDDAGPAEAETPEQALHRMIAVTALGTTGVHRLGTTAARVAGALRTAVGSTSTPGIRTSTTDAGLLVEVSVVAEYPAKVTDVADHVRTAVQHAVGQVGDEAVTVDVAVTDVHGPFDEADEARRQAAAEKRKAAVADARDSAKAKAGQVADTVRDRAGQVGDALQEKAGQASDTIQEKAAQVADKADEVREAASDEADELGQQASRKADELGDQARDLRDEAARRGDDAAASAGGAASDVPDGTTVTVTVEDGDTTVVVDPADDARRDGDDQGTSAR
jgi:uncharacterized alkaline shock family protein YloU